MGEVQDDNDGEGEEIQEFGIEAILSRPVVKSASPKRTEPLINLKAF
jgi:hypothetical protein